MEILSNMCKRKATLVKKIALLLSAVYSLTDEKVNSEEDASMQCSSFPSMNK